MKLINVCSNIFQELQIALQKDAVDLTIAVTLKKIGVKSMKTIFRGGAQRQMQLALSFLNHGKIPPEFFQLHNKLMKKKPEEFNGTVKSYLWP